MKTFKITKSRNEVISTETIQDPYIVLSGNNLCLIIEKEKARELTVGGKIRFEKTASGNSGQMLLVCSEDSTILTVEEDEEKKYVYFEYPRIKPLSLSSFSEIESESGYKYKFYFTSGHLMVPYDFDDYDFYGLGSYTLYVKRGGKTMFFSDLALCFPSEIEPGHTIDIEDMDCCKGEHRPFNYETMERNSILAKTSKATPSGAFIPAAGDEAFLCTNPFFFIGDDSEIIRFNNVSVKKYTDFRDLDVVLEQDYDAKRMFQEYQVNELFVKKIKNSIIPDFIDLEKIKYAPAFIGEITGEETGETTTVFELATGLTFNLHFRSRLMKPDPESVEEEYLFEDTWHLNDAINTWNWNGRNASGEFTMKTKDELYLDPEFVNSSNLIGYLGFTDDDIYNQKNRVKQSFLRLLFYDSDNPLTQNLLYYSTIFLDSGELFGKYVKRKAWLEDSDEEYDHLVNPVVWSPASPDDTCEAVTSRITVNDEYDITKSGEGFNLYLFRQDAPEKDPKDIYMKVEFNHAGYGRTVPLIYWRKGGDGTTPVDLDIKEYYKNLYIKLKIRLTEKGYVYTFDDATFVNKDDETTRCNGILWEDERLVFNLFEPMLKQEVKPTQQTNG